MVVCEVKSETDDKLFRGRVAKKNLSRGSKGFNSLIKLIVGDFLLTTSHDKSKGIF